MANQLNIQLTNTKIEANACPGCKQGWTDYNRPAGYGVYAIDQMIAKVYLCLSCTTIAKDGTQQQQETLDKSINAFLQQARKLEGAMEGGYVN